MRNRFAVRFFWLSTLLLLAIFFQNCSKPQFSDASNNEHSQKEESGNGGNYDGKISYVLSDSQNACSDGNPVITRIDKTIAAYILIREKCADLEPRELDSTLVSLDASRQFLTYGNLTLTQVRDPWLQPFSSTSVWNTSIGSTAQWSLDNDADTTDLLSVAPSLAAGEWSVPFFLGTVSDLVRTVNSSNMQAQTLHFPSDFHLSLPYPGTNAFVMMDPTKRWLHHYAFCKDTQQGMSCDYGAKDDSCGDGIGGYDLGRGIMRAWEIQSGEINHTLRFALPLSVNKPTGVAWPATAADFTGNAASKGNILYGSTIGIPSGIQIDSLGLSRGGKILAAALQNYGAIQRDTSGASGGIVFFAEEAAEGLPHLAEMRADLAKLVPHLRIMRDQSQSTPNGGGLRKKPALPLVDPGICH